MNTWKTIVVAASLGIGLGVSGLADSAAAMPAGAAVLGADAASGGLPLENVQYYGYGYPYAYGYPCVFPYRCGYGYGYGRGYGRGFYGRGYGGRGFHGGYGGRGFGGGRGHR